MTILKIAVTGGPCGGKTTSLAHIRALAEREGYRVLTVSETATELMKGGVTPVSCASRAVYQAHQISLQYMKEEVFLSAARGMDAERVLIVCDRGLPDNRAYMAEEEYLSILAARGESAEAYLSRYDAVFHLVTAADGAEDCYTTENNAVRTETIEEAREVDMRLRAAWEGHPRRYVIPNTGDFAEKTACLSAALFSFLGEMAE